MFKKILKKFVINNNCNFYEILENCKDIVFFYTPENFNCIYANQEAIKALGYSKEKLLNSTPSLYDYNFKDARNIKLLLEPLFTEKNKNICVKTNYKHRNGKLFPAEVTFSTAEINNKPVIVSVASNLFYKNFFEDSARNTNNILNQQARQKVKNILHEQLSAETILDNLPFSAWLKDENNRYIKTNDKFLQECNLPARDVIGKTDHEIWGTELAEKFYLADHKIISTGKEKCVEEFFTLQEEETWTETFRTSVRDKSDNILGMVGIRRNITEKKYIEKELFIAKELAESSNQLKSEFLSVMSHEIKTPMNGLMGFIQMLSQTQLDERQKKYIDNINISYDSLSIIINNVLDFSKIEAGKLTLESTKFNVEQVLKECVDIATHSANQKGLSINIKTFNLPAEKVYGDLYKLRQILNNLLNNSIKFTNQGEILLTAKTLSEDDVKVKLYFGVSDTGIGISRENISKVLEPFSQEDYSTTRTYGGTGLGLAICYKLVKLMHGDMHIDSEKGQGSLISFTVEFLKQEKMTQLERKDEITVKPCIAKEKDLSKCKILIADDDEMNIELLTEIIKTININYEVAHNGVEALDACRKNDYNLILMDCMMPLMDGYSAAREIKKLEGKDKSVIIALTANAMIGDAQKCLEAGMDDYISKPININNVISIIKKYV